MQIKARIPLNLPNIVYKVKLSYNTFVKSTYDNFLAASIVKNAKSTKEVETYIDDITGKGSLNSHLKKLCEKINKDFNIDQINDIIENSLYPKRVIEKYSFLYYQMFNVSIINIKGLKRLYKDNLSDQTYVHELENMLMPKDVGAKFENIEIEKDNENETGTIDYYDVKFADSSIEVALEGNEYLPISKNDFNKYFIKDDVKIEKYKGDIKTKLTEGNWLFLSTLDLNSINNSYGYKNSDGNYTTLTSSGLKVTEVLYLFGIYFFREIRYGFDYKNKEKFNEAIKEYVNHKWIGEIKSSTIVEVLKIVDDIVAQKVVQHILNRKNDTSIAEYALSLIDSGIEKGWDDSVIDSIKKNAPKNKFTKLYKISNNVKWSDEELIHIDDDVLSEIDSIRKKKYISADDNLRKDIKYWLGEFVSSAVREKIKSLQQSELKKRVKNFLNSNQGHNKEDINNYDHVELVKYHKKLKDFYEGDFNKIKAQCDKLDK